MAEKIAGIVASSKELDVVILEHDAGDFSIISQVPIKLQAGDRADAYRVAHDQLVDQLQNEDVVCVCIKASAVSTPGTRKAHLEAAELRGVAMAAAAAVCEVRCVNTGAVSRTSSRKVKDYLRDDDYWDTNGLSDLKKTMREAAFMAVKEFS